MNVVSRSLMWVSGGVMVSEVECEQYQGSYGGSMVDLYSVHTSLSSLSVILHFRSFWFEASLCQVEWIEWMVGVGGLGEAVSSCVKGRG